jgi:hypothetical protein
MINFLNYLLNNISLIIPSFGQILGFFGLIIFIFVSSAVGSLITRKINFSSNFFVGYSINYLFSLVLFSFKINVNYSFFSLALLALVIILKNFYFYCEKIKINLIQLKNKFILFIPLVAILISSQAIGWDTFTHWLPLADGIKSLENYPTHGHGKYYPFASSLVLSNSSIILHDISENVSALFSIFLLIIFFQTLSCFYKNIFKIKKNNVFTFFLVLYVFYNPIHMNKFVYTAYSDFISATVFFFLFYEMYKYFTKDNNLNIISLSLIASLLIGLKNTGLILVLILFFTFFLFLIYKKILSYKNFKSLMAFLYLPLLIFVIWQMSLSFNNILTDNFIKFSLIKEENIIFFKSAWAQILSRPIFYMVSLFTIFTLPFLKFIKNSKFNKINDITFLYMMIFLQWVTFVISTYILHFDINVFYANSFWRYCSQISLICSFVFLFYIIWFFKKFNLLNYKFLGTLFLILIIINPIIFSYKLRRDLDPVSLELRKFKKYQNQFKSVFLVIKNNTYEAEKLNYYLQKPYAQNIVQSVNIDNMSLSNFEDKIKENKYQLYIYLKKDINNKITKKIYYK